MTRQTKSAEIRKFIVAHVDEHPADIARMTAERFGITRQAVRRHLVTLIEDGLILGEGERRHRKYHLNVREHEWSLPLSENREEDKVWRQLISPLVADAPENVRRICYYGFTEMFNNAIDHSEGTIAIVTLNESAKKISISIYDNGIGIFKKIKEKCQLDDERQAILELAKGKLTTDPSRHSGQGIFFTSRSFDRFSLTSGTLHFSHTDEHDDWLIEGSNPGWEGTGVQLEISTCSERTLKEVFDRFTDLSNDEYPFSKTHVPLKLAKYGDEALISRSQAKRVLARFDRFDEIILDFEGVEEIGQSFADEVFRVYPNNNPKASIHAIRTNPEVDQMIRRATSSSPGPG